VREIPETEAEAVEQLRLTNTAALQRRK